MKKTIIALAVAALAAGSANATVIYEQDGTKIDLDGRLHMEIQSNKSERGDLRDVGSRIRFRAFQEIGGGFSALGAIELRFSQARASSTKTTEIGGDFRTHRLFAGFTHPEIGSLTFGRQLHLGDHVPKANYTYEWGGNSFFDAHNKAAHFMSARFNGFRFAADYYFGNSDKDVSSGNGGEQGYGVGLFYDGKFGENIAVRFGSNYTEVTKYSSANLHEFKLKRGGVGFDIRYNIVTFGVDWAFAKATKDENTGMGFQSIAHGSESSFNKNDRFLFGLKVNVTDKNAIYGQYYLANAKKANVSDKYKMQGWMIGADHKFNKHVAVYVEGGAAKVKHTGSETFKNHKVLVGTRIMF